MHTRHAKCPKCGAGGVHFGGRRRRCRNCRTTWSIRQQRRGRRPRRTTSDLPRRVLVAGRTARVLAADFGCSIAAANKRLRYSLEQLAQQPLAGGIPDGDLVLLADGLWFSFQCRPWVLYDMAVKPVTENIAYVLDPLILPGKETARCWGQAIATIPDDILERIRALISDGFRGSRAIAREYHWVQQRCHFHVLAQLYNRLGIRKPRLPGQPIRLEIYAAVRTALGTASETELARATSSLRQLAGHTECPRRVAGIAREFLRDIALYRAYLRHPELQLPITVSTLESQHGRFRGAVTCVNNPQAVLRRVRGFIRLHPTITCNPAIYQQN